MPDHPIVVILGPTASGKSNLGIKLAQKFNGEIISADSRQVYKGMDIGTGKVSKKEQRQVIHHLIDVVSAEKQFTVADFQRLAQIALAQIRSRSKLPFIVGGTAFYIYTLTDNWQIPEVAPNPELRNLLNTKPTEELLDELVKLDPIRAQNIDVKNPARLIRAIEILRGGQKIPPQSFGTFSATPAILFLGLKKGQPELFQLIDQRLAERLENGLVAEVQKLYQLGMSWTRLETFGLEYRYIAYYLQKKLPYGEMVAKLQTEIHRFAKRQMTWFKRDPRIHWISNQSEAEKLIKDFLKKI